MGSVGDDPLWVRDCGDIGAPGPWCWQGLHSPRAPREELQTVVLQVPLWQLGWAAAEQSPGSGLKEPSEGWEQGRG